MVVMGAIGGYCFGMELADKLNQKLDALFEDSSSGNELILSSFRIVKFFRREWTQICLCAVGSTLGVVTTFYAFLPEASIM